MKVTLISKTNLDSPHLKLDINLDKATFDIKLTYTCPKCSGYGCHFNGPCDSSKHLAPEDVVPTLGDDVKPILKEMFQKILGDKL